MKKMILFLALLTITLNSYACQCEQGTQALFPKMAAKLIVEKNIPIKVQESEITLLKYIPSFFERVSSFLNRSEDNSSSSCKIGRAHV